MCICSNRCPDDRKEGRNLLQLLDTWVSLPLRGHGAHHDHVVARVFHGRGRDGGRCYSRGGCSGTTTTTWRYNILSSSCAKVRRMLECKQSWESRHEVKSLILHVHQRHGGSMHVCVRCGRDRKWVDVSECVCVWVGVQCLGVCSVFVRL